MSEKRTILILEDSDDDYELLQRLLRNAGVAAPMERQLGANPAIARLCGTILETAPSLVLADLSMPDGDGFEFLSWAKSQAAFQDTLLVVLSSTRRGADIDRAYSLGAHFFLSKFPTAEMLARLCAAAEKRDIALQSRLGNLRREPAIPA